NPVADAHKRVPDPDPATAGKGVVCHDGLLWSAATTAVCFQETDWVSRSGLPARRCFACRLLPSAAASRNSVAQAREGRLMKSILTAFVMALAVGPVLAQPPGAGGQAQQQPARLEQQMRQMADMMERMQATQDPAE